MTNQSREMRAVVPDTSVIAEAVLSKHLEAGRLKPELILIPQAVVAELEHQANQGKETGYLGLDEITKLREEANGRWEVSFVGGVPNSRQIQEAKDGSIDAMIRNFAREEGATLVTADRVQALVAKAQNIDVYFVDFSEGSQASLDDPLAEFFKEDTMSVHLKEDAQTVRKGGMPGKWLFEPIDHHPDGAAVESLAKRIVAAAQQRRDSFIEIERPGSSIVQLGKYRIVIARPPFASRWEITAVRPVKQLTLDEYEFPEKFQKRLETSAEGILVSGSPGEGKSTFTQALGSFYASQDKIVKTVEAPRDLVLPEGITQYSASHGTPEEIRDVLLLNRPDYTIYDEIRNNQDFMLYADMRMSGIGMIGVVHAAGAIDSIQRFIGRIELGVVPQVVDTVVYIKGGKIAKVLSLKMQVKVPAGMTEADLARPVIVVSDFFKGEPEYELYTYGDQTVVVPVDEVEQQGAGKEKSAVMRMAEDGLRDYFSQFSKNIDVEMQSASRATIFVPKKQIGAIIGKGGDNIHALEEELGIKLDVEELTGERAKKSGIEFKVKSNKSNVTIFLPPVYANKEVSLYDYGEFLLTATASKNAEISINLKSSVGKEIKKAADKGRLEVLT